MSVRRTSARVGAPTASASAMNCCAPAAAGPSAALQPNQAVVIGGGPMSALPLRRPSADVDRLQERLSGLFDASSCTAPRERGARLLPAALTSMSRFLGSLLHEVRAGIARVPFSRAGEPVAPTITSSQARAEVEAYVPPAPIAADQPRLPPTGIQLFIAAPRQAGEVLGEATPAGEPSTVDPGGSPPDGRLVAGIATWVASLKRVSRGDLTEPIGELGRRLDRWRARHRLTRMGLLVLTVVAPIAVAFLTYAASQVLAGH